MQRAEDETNEIVWETPENPPKPHDYIFHHGRRMVRPYYFEFIAHVKNRWAGKKVVDLFSHEFRQRPYEYYVEAVKSGRICVDGKLVSAEYVVKASQKLSHFVHRHEPPVMAEPIMILEEGTDVITVCKPSSIPIEAGKVQKEYVAKVKGVFPAEEVEVDANVIYDAREGKSTTEVGDGSNEQLSKGKTACTKFVRLGTDGVFSIVKCLPISGRTHQIRVHLQHLGHPIANDALYSLEIPPDRSIEGTSADRAARRSHTLVSVMGESKLPISALSEQCNSCEQGGILFNEDKRNPSTGSQSRKSAVDDLAGTIKRQKVEGRLIMNKRPENSLMRDPAIDFQEGNTDVDIRLSMHNSENFELHLSIDPVCTNCPNVAPSGHDEHEDGLWLHCVRYSGPGWAYECRLPQWAHI